MQDNQPVAISFPDTSFNSISLATLFSSYVVYDSLVIGISKPGFEVGVPRARQAITSGAIR